MAKITPSCLPFLSKRLMSFGPLTAALLPVPLDPGAAAPPAVEPPTVVSPGPVTVPGAPPPATGPVALLQPEAVAIISTHGTRPFAQLSARANQIPRTLRAAGLAPGDSVALLCSNRPEFVEVMQGAQRCGVRLTPINWHITAEEASYILRDCEAKAVFADIRFAQVAATAVADSEHAKLRLAIGGPINGFDDYDDH